MIDQLYRGSVTSGEIEVASTIYLLDLLALKVA